MDFYSIKMRASKNKSGNSIHISGAEKIVDKDEIKICSIEDNILRLEALPITQADIDTIKDGYSEIKKQISNIDISKADEII